MKRRALENSVEIAAAALQNNSRKLGGSIKCVIRTMFKKRDIFATLVLTIFPKA